MFEKYTFRGGFIPNMAVSLVIDKTNFLRMSERTRGSKLIYANNMPGQNALYQETSNAISIKAYKYHVM